MPDQNFVEFTEPGPKRKEIFVRKGRIAALWPHPDEDVSGTILSFGATDSLIHVAESPDEVLNAIGATVESKIGQRGSKTKNYAY